MIKYLLILGLLWSCSPSPTSSEIVVEKKYFPSGKIMEIRHLQDGIRTGLQTAYWENGNKRFEYTAKNDAYEGELKEWDEQGRLFHLGHYKNGQEEGEQKMWHADGKIRSNFVIIKGKRYGLLGTKNCILIDEKFFDN